MHASVICSHFCNIHENIPVLFTILSLKHPMIKPWTYYETNGEKKVEASIHARKITVLLDKQMPDNFDVAQIMTGAGFYKNRDSEALKHKSVTALVRCLNVYWTKYNKKTEKISTFSDRKEAGNTRYADLLSGKFIEDNEMMDFFPDSVVFNNDSDYPPKIIKVNTNHEHFFVVQAAALTIPADKPGAFATLIDDNLQEISQEANLAVCAQRYKSIKGKLQYLAQQYCLNGKDESAVRRLAVLFSRFRKMEAVVLDTRMKEDVVNPNNKIPPNKKKSK